MVFVNEYSKEMIDIRHPFTHVYKVTTISVTRCHDSASIDRMLPVIKFLSKIVQ